MEIMNHLHTTTTLLALCLIGQLSAAPAGKKTFTILHTNDLHSAFLGLGPVTDYRPSTLNDDKTRGGYARQATLIAQREQARKELGPVLVLSQLSKGELPVIPVDKRANEVRAIKAGG